MATPVNAFATLSLDHDASIDGFGRLRISEVYTVFDSKQLVDNLPLYFDDIEFSGSGTITTHSEPRASSIMSVAANTAGVHIRQTFRRFNYQPGKSQVAIFTFVMPSNGEGVIKQVGLFDGENGLFFEMNGEIPTFVIRSNVSGDIVELRFPQASWNVDRFDGQSFNTPLDFTKGLIFFIDFEWLGTGSVRFGFYHHGIPLIAHREHHAGVASSVYMSTPNLPIRYAIVNDGSGAAQQMEHICATVISEAGVQDNGTVTSISRGVQEFEVDMTDDDIYPLLSIRLKDTHFDMTIDLLNANIIGGDLTAMGAADKVVAYRYLILWNPDIGGIDNADWISKENSAIEYDISRDLSNTVSNGYVIIEDYAIGAINNREIPTTQLKLGSSILGVPDEIVLCVQRIGTQKTTFLGSMTWRELA